MEMRTLVGTVLEPQLSAPASTPASMFGFRLPAFECQSLTASQRSGGKEVSGEQQEADMEQDEEQALEQALAEKDANMNREEAEEDNFCIDIETEDEQKPELFPASNVEENPATGAVGSSSYFPNKFHLFPPSMEQMATTEDSGQSVH